MDNRYVLKQLRYIVADFYDEDGNKRETIRYRFLNKNISSEAISLLSEILGLIMSHNYFSNVTRIYIKDRNITRSELASYLKMKETSLNSKMYRDIKKFINDFGESCISDLSQSTSADLSKYTRKLFELSNNEKEFYKCVDLDLTKALGAYHTELDEERFNYVCTLLNVYTKAYKDRIVSSLTQEDLGYINYLFINSNKTEKENNDFKRLLALSGELSFDTLKNRNIYKELGYKDDEIDDINSIIRG